jgi:short-subunit dehydrogenase
MSKPLALVTGASSGIGRAFSDLLLAQDHDVAVVGRDASKLAATGGFVVREDLAVPGSAERIMAALEGRPVDVLVLNAGFGLHGRFWETNSGLEQAMLRTHLDSALDLARAVLPDMVKRGRGKVITVSSLYAFVPGPKQAVYAATKSFLYTWSLSLSAELAGTGVTATCVLPGPTRSGFHERAGLKPKAGGMKAEYVAETAWHAAQAGRAVVIPGLTNKAFVRLSRLLPAAVLPQLMKAVNRARGV